MYANATSKHLFSMCANASMGTLIFNSVMTLKVTLLIYGWMSTPVVLVTGGLILLVKINKIKGG